MKKILYSVEAYKSASSSDLYTVVTGLSLRKANEVVRNLKKLFGIDCFAARKL